MLQEGVGEKPPSNAGGSNHAGSGAAELPRCSARRRQPGAALTARHGVRRALKTPAMVHT